MAYEALARRYRSQSFGSVVGQGPIARTLTNAISADRLHHAYLFCGTRGVGKTSMARILARALNAPVTIEDCPPPPDPENYPADDVQWRMAEAVMRGEDLNVIEIDGASNRGVDDARQLIAAASLAPTDNARYKIYIIDEVHMLTKDAFNTLLKTMEEPPSHLKFILCTTEPEKVLPTIQSRCQRFDFRNIPTGEIKKHLLDVLEKESIEAEDAVVARVARLGNGSMRDALSLLDRLLATGENPITVKTLEVMMGLPDRDLIAGLMEAMATSDPKIALEQMNQLLVGGTSIDQSLHSLIDATRDLLLAVACGADSDLLEVDEDTRKQLKDLSDKFDVVALVHMIAMLEMVQDRIKRSPTPRALLDATIVRLALSEKFADIAGLVAAAGAVKKKVINESDSSQGAGSGQQFALNAPSGMHGTGSGAGVPALGRSGAGDSSDGDGASAAGVRRPAPGQRTMGVIGRLSADDRQRALNLPVVKELMEQFDLTLMGVREEAPPVVPVDPTEQTDQDSEEKE